MPPRGTRDRFEVIGEIKRRQSTNPKKGIYLQRVQFEGGRKEIRLGYYILGKLPRMRNRWVWGQYATFMPLADFRFLVNQAKRRGWL
jgi:hypothetical protein